MDDVTTPLRGHQSGEGWHLRPGRVLGNRVVLLILAAGVLVGAGVLARDGRWAGAVVVALLALAVGALPFDRNTRQVPARVYRGRAGTGLLLPSQPMRVTAALALVYLGLLLLAAPVAVLVGSDAGGGRLVGQVAAALVPALVGAFLACSGGAVLVTYRRPDRGILLTPDEVVLRTQAQPMRFAWDDVERVRPHWNRFRPLTDRYRSPEDPVHNWLSFGVSPYAVVGPNPLRLMAGTTEPVVDVHRLALEPTLVLATCRFYLEHPEARPELVSTSALDRVTSLARSLDPPP